VCADVIAADFLYHRDIEGMVSLSELPSGEARASPTDCERGQHGS